MTEFEPIVFERVVQGAPDRTKNDTQLFVLRAMNGISRVVEPEDSPILPVEDRTSGIRRRMSETCRSNPDQALSAADINEAKRLRRNLEGR